MKAGFIGLGIMGKPMCKNLIKAGHDLIVTTHNPDTLKEMEALGAKAVHNGKEVAEEAEVIITMLPNSPQVREVALGKGGIIEGGRRGIVLIDMSSIDPTESKAISAVLAERESICWMHLYPEGSRKPLTERSQLWLAEKEKPLINTMNFL